ncbi:hypothetical protein ACLOJK_036125 [Asimina triloba]
MMNLHWSAARADDVGRQRTATTGDDRASDDGQWLTCGGTDDEWLPLLMGFRDRRREANLAVGRRADGRRRAAVTDGVGTGSVMGGVPVGRAGRVAEDGRSDLGRTGRRAIWQIAAAGCTTLDR